MKQNERTRNKLIKLFYKILGISNEERYLIESIISARKVQDFLWGEYNKQWSLEEWKRMFKKRIVKIDEIESNNPHAKIELKKRLLQNAALCVALLNIIGTNGFNETCDIPSNLPQYSTSPSRKKSS